MNITSLNCCGFNKNYLFFNRFYKSNKIYECHKFIFAPNKNVKLKKFRGEWNQSSYVFTNIRLFTTVKDSLPSSAISDHPFSLKAWNLNQDCYNCILQHPFIKQLGIGTLPLVNFLFYMQQDIHYLNELSVVVELLLKKAVDYPKIQFALKHIGGRILQERKFCQEYLEKCQMSLHHQKSPTCENYINFLMNTVQTGSLAEGIAALLPCFWIYQKLGGYIYRLAPPQTPQQSWNNPYKEWIDKYGQKTFSYSVNLLLDSYEQVAKEATPQIRKKMIEAFSMTCAWEFKFWQSCYILEKREGCHEDI